MPTSGLGEQIRRLPPYLKEIVEGYASGHFLMDNEGMVSWYAADPHTLLPLDGSLHIPKSMKRVLNQKRFQTRIDTDFEGVVAGCRNRESTWISEELADIYRGLHAQGIVHSFETWQQNSLAGGVLGLALGGVFIGESMFTSIEDGGKTALIYLVDHLRTRGFTLFDVQLTNPHLERFGSYEVPLSQYLTMLRTGLSKPSKFL